MLRASVSIMVVLFLFAVGPIAVLASGTLLHVQTISSSPRNNQSSSGASCASCSKTIASGNALVVGGPTVSNSG
jgi:hypothetical protein